MKKRFLATVALCGILLTGCAIDEDARKLDVLPKDAHKVLDEYLDLTNGKVIDLDKAIELTCDSTSLRFEYERYKIYNRTINATFKDILEIISVAEVRPNLYNVKMYIDSKSNGSVQRTIGIRTSTGDKPCIKTDIIDI